MTRQLRVSRQPTTVIGARAEAIAAEYLATAGYQILARNVRYRLGEIDLIAAFGDLTIFVEVRSRSSIAFGCAQVNIQKQRQVAKVAAWYVATQGSDAGRFRFDVVFLNGAQVEHLVDAWRL